MSTDTLPEADARSHVVTIERPTKGSEVTIGGIAHAGSCTPSECPYQDLVGLHEAADEADLKPGDYRVTGGEHPKFERVFRDDGQSPGAQPPEDLPDVYAVVDPDLPEPPKPAPFKPGRIGR